MPANPQSPISAYKTYRVGESNAFVIHAGQTIRMYQAFADISGSKIISDAPLTVISGHNAAQIPLGATGAVIQWQHKSLLLSHGVKNSSCLLITIGLVVSSIKLLPTGLEQIFKGDVALVLQLVPLFPLDKSISLILHILLTAVLYRISQYMWHMLDQVLSLMEVLMVTTLNTVPPISQYIHSIEYTRYFAIFSGVNLLIPRDQYFSNNLILDNTLYSVSSWDSTIYFPNGTIAGYGWYDLASGTHTFTHPNTSGGIFLSVWMDNIQWICILRWHGS